MIGWWLAALLTAALAAEPGEDTDEESESSEPSASSVPKLGSTGDESPSEGGDTAPGDDGTTPDAEPRRDPLRRLPTPTEAARKAPRPAPAPEPSDGGLDDWEALEPGAELDVAPDADIDEEMTVWGSGAINRAREKVVRSMRAQGWEPKARRDDGTLVFAGPEGWMGAALISADGLIRFRRRLVNLSRQEPIELAPDSRVSSADRVARTGDPSVGTGGGISGPASKRKLQAVQSELQENVDEELRGLRRVIAETALREQLGAIPPRLQRLWSEGLPVQGTTVHATPADRRAALVAYWASRPATRFGRMAQQAVADFVQEVVQNSDDPFTQAELDAAHQAQPDAPPLSD